MSAENKECYLFSNLKNPRVVYGFSRRADQNMSLFYGDTSRAIDNRNNFLEGLKIDYRNLVCAKQVHASGVRCVTEEYKGKGALSYEDSIADTDAFITDKENLPLAIFTADCLSIFLYDPLRPAIGLVHAGWRSTKENIAVKTIEFMKNEFNTNAAILYVGFGPAIRNCCYKVSIDFENFFRCGVIKRSAGYYLDLIEVNKKQILGCGVKAENISDSGICTYCRNEDFFSYRKEGKDCGRTMSVIMLKNRTPYE